MVDCEGVLWRGDRLIDGAVQVLDMLPRASECVHRYRNPRNGSLMDNEQKTTWVLFVTNNATKSRGTLKANFDRLGVQAHIRVVGPVFVHLLILLDLPPNASGIWQGPDHQVFGRGLV